MSNLKVSDHLKHINTRLTLGNTIFFNKIVEAVKAKIEADTGIKVEFTGKEETKTGISGVLIGTTADPAIVETADAKVRQSMQDLKNPTALLDLLR